MKSATIGVRGRGLAALVAAACLLAPAVASAAPTPEQAAAELNVWRAEVGETPVATPTNATLDTGCADHDNYEHMNGNTLSHVETNGDPGFSTLGSEAGVDSVLAETVGPASDAALLPGPVWDAGVFHRAALLQPRLALTGFDATAFGSVTFACMWIQNQSAQDPAPVMDNTRTTPGLALYPSPANGAYHVPTVFPAHTESPDPAQETGVPPGATLGWLLNVEINGPWADGQFGNLAYAHDVTATLAPDGTTNDVPVVVSQCGSSGCFGGGGTSEGIFFQGGFGIFPTQPLAANTTYRVVLTGGAVTDTQDGVQDPVAGFSWCFSTGATYTVSPDCAAPTTAAEEVSHPNASTAVSVTPTTPSTGTPPGTGPGGVPGAPGATGPGGTGPGTSPGTSPGTGSGPPGTGPGTGHRGARPSTRGSLLTGLRRRHPRLVLRLHAASGAAAIRRVAITLPHGLSLAHRPAALRSGVQVTSAGHRARASLRRHRRVLTVTLRHARRRVVVTLARPALRVNRSLARARHLTRLTFSIVTTAGRSTIRQRVRLAPG
jgi:hypothetical protein